jgi:uncharacterized membrane protein
MVPALSFALLSSIYVISMKHISNHITTPTILTIIGIFYFLFTISYYIYHKNIIHNDITNINNNILFILLLAVVASSLSTIIYHDMLQGNGSAVITSITSLTPVFVALLAWLILKEKITTSMMIGILIIVVGTYILTI